MFLKIILQPSVHPLHVVNYWMNNSVRVTQKHYLQITDDHRLAGCGIASESKALSPAVANATLSETVALLIHGWDNMCPEERALLTALLWANTSNVNHQC